MKNYHPSEIKNIALVGNAGSGKTTLAEAICLAGGIINRKGDVDSKNTVSDFLEIEQEYNRSVFSTVLYTEWKEKKINYIDAPGLDDFIGGAISSFTVVDTAVSVINAQQGVEVGTEVIGRYTEKLGKPMMFVINHLDHEKTNYEKTLENLKEWFGNKATVIQYPVNPGLDFDSIIDVLTMKMYKFSDGKIEPEILDIPDSEIDKAKELNNQLIEAAAENDEPLMELFFEKGSLDENEMRKGISAGLISRGLFPIFCTSAEKNYGIKRLLEFITNVAPAPNMLSAIKTIDEKEIECKEGGNTNIFVFKTSNESHIGEINYFKVISGQVSEGIDLTNNNSSTKERLSQLYAVACKNRTKFSKLVAVDIGAAVKLKNT
ncbi:MAG: GTP-binding protein, partial [Bacteroidales bacterium]|nr:GTP-binding protein [Bacteroidales bacterium]